jgi:hypothetical protein
MDKLKALGRYLDKNSQTQNGSRPFGSGPQSIGTGLHGSKRQRIISSKIIDESEEWERRLGKVASDGK